QRILIHPPKTASARRKGTEGNTEIPVERRDKSEHAQQDLCNQNKVCITVLDELVLNRGINITDSLYILFGITIDINAPQRFVLFRYESDDRFKYLYTFLQQKARTSEHSPTCEIETEH